MNTYFKEVILDFKKDYYENINRGIITQKNNMSKEQKEYYENNKEEIFKKRSL